jgi:hypothetical protein
VVTSCLQGRADALVAIAAVNLKASDRCQLIMHVQTGVGNSATLLVLVTMLRFWKRHYYLPSIIQLMQTLLLQVGWVIRWGG